MEFSLHFVLALLGAACLAGFFGALLGVGGGVFIVPVMVLMFHLPMKVAVAASIVSVIATSNAGGSSYVEQRITNLKLAMLLEIATTIGALTGSVLAIYLQQWLMLIIFAAMLAYMSYAAFTTRENSREPSRIACRGTWNCAVCTTTWRPIAMWSTSSTDRLSEHPFRIWRAWRPVCLAWAAEC